MYWQAFARKLRAGFTDAFTGEVAVRAALRADRMLVARVRGQVVGVCGFYDQGVGAVDLTWSTLARTLSVPATMRACLVLSLLSRRSDSRSLVLDGICVESTHRGLGVGTALLEAATERARQMGHHGVQLTVVDDNIRARELYERCGFVPISSGSLAALSGLYGFDTYTTMERVVVP